MIIIVEIDNLLHYSFKFNNFQIIREIMRYNSFIDTF
jgi:hypothetical protein